MRIHHLARSLQRHLFAVPEHTLSPICTGELECILLNLGQLLSSPENNFVRPRFQPMSTAWFSVQVDCHS